MKRSTFITWDQLKVGAVIVGAIVVMVVAMYKLGEAANLFTKRYQLVTFVSSANGLLVGGSVTVAGQLAGTVRSIDFLPVDGDTTKNLKITVEVARSLQPQIRGDSRGKLRTQGLLGDKLLDISPGTPRYGELQPGDTIVMSPSLDYEQVIAQAAGAVSDMVALTHDVKQLTGGIIRGEGTMGQLLTNRSLYDELTGTLARTNTMIARLQNPRGTVGRLIDDPQLYYQLTGMIASVDTLLRQVNSPNGTLGKLMRDDTLYTHLVDIAAGADSLLKQLSNGNGAASQLLKDPQLYDQLLKSVTDLNAMIADIRKDPHKYLKGIIKVF